MPAASAALPAPGFLASGFLPAASAAFDAPAFLPPAPGFLASGFLPAASAALPAPGFLASGFLPAASAAFDAPAFLPAACAPGGLAAALPAAAFLPPAALGSPPAPFFASPAPPPSLAALSILLASASCLLRLSISDEMPSPSGAAASPPLLSFSANRARPWRGPASYIDDYPTVNTPRTSAVSVARELTRLAVISYVPGVSSAFAYLPSSTGRGAPLCA